MIQQRWAWNEWFTCAPGRHTVSHQFNLRSSSPNDADRTTKPIAWPPNTSRMRKNKRTNSNSNINQTTSHRSISKAYFETMQYITLSKCIRRWQAFELEVKYLPLKSNRHACFQCNIKLPVSRLDKVTLWMRDPHLNTVQTSLQTSNATKTQTCAPPEKKPFNFINRLKNCALENQANGKHRNWIQWNCIQSPRFRRNDKRARCVCSYFGKMNEINNVWKKIQASFRKAAQAKHPRWSILSPHWRLFRKSLDKNSKQKIVRIQDKPIPIATTHRTSTVNFSNRQVRFVSTQIFKTFSTQTIDSRAKIPENYQRKEHFHENVRSENSISLCFSSTTRKYRKGDFPLAAWISSKNIKQFKNSSQSEHTALYRKSNTQHFFLQSFLSSLYFYKTFWFFSFSFLFRLLLLFHFLRHFIFVTFLCRSSSSSL